MRPTDRQRSQARPWNGVRAPQHFLLAALGAALLITGCVAGLQPPPGRPPAPPPAGYERMVDSLTALDRAPLAGKKIVLDPGHGGFFKGALGVHGLTEAEVNLGVALDLAAILRAHGAEVLLTRETDRDFLTSADSSLRSDLNTRVKENNDFKPDLFLSIHHNADPRGAHDVNETQVYYQLGDDGAALDAASDVDRFLTRNLGIGASRLLAGNYAVLRGSEAPAILTESSYITYPPTEAKLATESARRIEAQSLALGIAAFFARKAPVIEEFGTPVDPRRPGTAEFDAGFLELHGFVRGAADQIELTLDGRPLEPLLRVSRLGTTVAWKPAAPLAWGGHEATLLARLSGEGSTRRARFDFELRPRADSIAIDFPHQLRANDGTLVAARIRLLSDEGVAVQDTAAIRLSMRGPMAPAETTVTLRDGVAWAYFSPAARRGGRRRTEGRSWIELAAERAALRGRARLTWLPHLGASTSDFALRMPEGARLADAPGTEEPEPRVHWINRDGFVFDPTFDPASPWFQNGRDPARDRERLPGYRTWWSDTLLPRRFVPIASGALHERRIVIDPAGGGDDPGGVSPSGTRGATLNLDVARMLQSMLEAAGAEVLLTRTSDAPVSDFERVKIAEGFHADRFVRIGHPPAPARLGHYFSSAIGTRWANDLAELAPRFGLPRPSVGDDAQYPIQQSSASALYVQLGRVDSTGAAYGAPDPARLRAEAYAIYLSLARQWAPQASWPLDSLTVRDPEGRPIPRAAVRLGTLVLETDSLGVVRFARTEPGPMLVQVDGIPEASRVLLDSERGVVLTGRPAP